MTGRAVIGSAVALVAGSLWAAAAFSSHNGAFYNHLAWWFGGTMIGAAFLGSVVAGRALQGLGAALLSPAALSPSWDWIACGMDSKPSPQRNFQH